MALAALLASEAVAVPVGMVMAVVRPLVGGRDHSPTGAFPYTQCAPQEVVHAPQEIAYGWDQCRRGQARHLGRALASYCLPELF